MSNSLHSILKERTSSSYHAQKIDECCGAIGKSIELLIIHVIENTIFSGLLKKSQLNLSHQSHHLLGPRCFS